MTGNEYLEILRQRFTEIDAKKFYLSYSGGKDSHFLYWFIREYAKIPDIEIVGVDTFMEHDEILQRIYKNADTVLQPTMKPYDIKERYGIPCFSKYQDSIIYRYQNGSRAKDVIKAIERKDVIKFKLNKTAAELLKAGELHKISSKCDLCNKKRPVAEFTRKTGKKGIIGVRCAESLTRKENYKSYFTAAGLFAPIFDLSDEIEDAIYKEYNIQLPSLYKYLDRTGCMGCPYGFHGGNTYKELSLLPEEKRSVIIDLFHESYDILGIEYKNLMGIEVYSQIDINNKVDHEKIRACQQCGKVFYQGRETKGLFCSRKCQHDSMRKKI